MRCCIVRVCVCVCVCVLRVVLHYNLIKYRYSNVKLRWNRPCPFKNHTLALSRRYIDESNQYINMCRFVYLDCQIFGSRYLSCSLSASCHVLAVVRV